MRSAGLSLMSFISVIFSALVGFKMRNEAWNNKFQFMLCLLRSLSLLLLAFLLQVCRYTYVQTIVPFTYSVKHRCARFFKAFSFSEGLSKNETFSWVYSPYHLMMLIMYFSQDYFLHVPGVTYGNSFVLFNRMSCAKKFWSPLETQRDLWQLKACSG